MIKRFVLLLIAVMQGIEGFNYDVKPVSYSPALTLPAYEGTEILNCDDCNEKIPIGFTFNFYGVNYTELYVGSHGYLTFNAGSNVYATQPIPNPFFPATIFGFWRDLDPREGTVFYTTTGKAPNRRLVVSFNKVPYYSSTSFVTMQFVLCEKTNNIGLYYLEWTGDTAITEGVQDQWGNSATPIPGRNNSAIEASNAPEGWLFGEAILPPINGRGIQVVDRFATQAELVNIIAWEPALVDQEVTYAIYSDSDLTQLLAIISPSAPLVYQQHNSARNQTATYYVVAKGANGFSSLPLRIVVKPL
jgi:hypothetical protein